MALDPDLRARLRLPAVCAPMTLVSGPELVGAACAAGLMAGLPRHNARSEAEFESWLKAIRETLDRRRDERPDATIGPLAVNLATAMSADDSRQALDLCRRYGADIVITARGDPAEMAKRVHDWGGRIFHDVTRMRFVEKALEAAVDGMTCIVAGGGGHSGLLSPFAFVPRVRAMFDGTIILAGGITSGADIRVAELLGADLAYLGTRFIATREARADPDYKRMLVEGGAEDLVFSGRVTGVVANWLKESLVAKGLDPTNLPVSAGQRNYDHLPDGVRPWRDLWSAGQGIEMIDDIPPVAEFVERLAAEYEAACALPPFRP
jgi:nitronate monooxygenase